MPSPPTGATRAIPEPFTLRGNTTFVDAYASLWPTAVSAALRVLRSRPLAEDVAQDVFLELGSRPQNFDPERGSLTTYVSVLARSRALDRARTNAVHRRVAEQLVSTCSRFDAVAPPADTTITNGVRELVAAVRELPDSQREAVLLAYGGGHPAREIAAIADAPVGTAKSRVRLGLKKLHAALSAAD